MDECIRILSLTLELQLLSGLQGVYECGHGSGRAVGMVGLGEEEVRLHGLLHSPLIVALAQYLEISGTLIVT